MGEGRRWGEGRGRGGDGERGGGGVCLNEQVPDLPAFRQGSSRGGGGARVCLPPRWAALGIGGCRGPQEDLLPEGGADGVS